MGKLLTDKEVGGNSTKYVSGGYITGTYGWDTDSNNNKFTSNAYFDVNWTGSDDGQSYVQFNGLGFAITQCKSEDTNYSTISGSKFILSGSKNKSGWGSVSGSIRITPNTFELAAPDAGYYIIIEAQGMPASYDYDVVYERRKVYMGTSVKEFIQKLKNSSIHVATEYINGQISVHTSGLS